MNSGKMVDNTGERDIYRQRKRIDAKKKDTGNARVNGMVNINPDVFLVFSMKIKGKIIAMRHMRHMHMIIFVAYADVNNFILTY